MQVIKNQIFASIYLRAGLACSYLWEVADRLGILGAHGQPHVGWGDWSHFMDYAKQTMAFMPQSIIPVFGVIATICEGLFGLLLLAGLFTRYAAIGSALLSLAFGISMAISFGIESPLGYSVFTVSAASLLVASLPNYKWSIDSLLNKNQIS
ncbi:MAG: DoxX family membrane protein [Bacteroidota bacterium]|nr:DoxX family membrane protein [Bacteroidota bacterium]